MESDSTPEDDAGEIRRKWFADNVNVTVTLMRPGDPPPQRLPRPADDACAEEQAKWVAAEIAADMYDDAPKWGVQTEPQAVGESLGLFGRCMENVLQKYPVMREQVDRVNKLFDDACAGDRDAQVQIVATCGPHAALLFCAPEDAQRVADVADALWLRAETAAW